MNFDGSKILLCVSGSIAAYKAVYLGRELLRNGAEIRIAMTENGAKFVTPLTFRAALSAPVIVNQLDEPEKFDMEHISWARWADLILVAPATANIIAKVAAGIADDFVSTTILATKSPVAFVPAMNTAMLQNPATQRNIRIAEELGYYVMQTDSGALACGEEGEGRFPEVSQIIDFVKYLLVEGKKLAEKKILITAGPTREFIDPVRFLSNPSSGKTGILIADAARKMGADVTLVHGPINIPIPDGIESISVISADEMHSAVMDNFKNCDCAIMTAAVADFTVPKKSDAKIKKGDGNLKLELVQTKDILAELGKIKGEKFLIGFALETENIEENARKKLASKNLDMIVANLQSKNTGFESDTNEALLLFADGEIKKIPLTSKRKLAKEILRELSKRI